MANPFQGKSDEELIALAPGTGIEMTRRLKEATERGAIASTILGTRIWWLNVWLLIFTIAICVLTAVLVAESFGWWRRWVH